MGTFFRHVKAQCQMIILHTPPRGETGRGSQHPLRPTMCLLGPRTHSDRKPKGKRKKKNITCLFLFSREISYSLGPSLLVPSTSCPPPEDDPSSRLSICPLPWKWKDRQLSVLRTDLQNSALLSQRQVINSVWSVGRFMREEAGGE